MTEDQFIPAGFEDGKQDFDPEEFNRLLEKRAEAEAKYGKELVVLMDSPFNIDRISIALEQLALENKDSVIFEEVQSSLLLVIDELAEATLVLESKGQEHVDAWKNEALSKAMDELEQHRNQFK